VLANVASLTESVPSLNSLADVVIGASSNSLATRCGEKATLGMCESVDTRHILRGVESASGARGSSVTGDPLLMLDYHRRSRRLGRHTVDV